MSQTEWEALYKGVNNSMELDIRLKTVEWLRKLGYNFYAVVVLEGKLRCHKLFNYLLQHPCLLPSDHRPFAMEMLDLAERYEC